LIPQKRLLAKNLASNCFLGVRFFGANQCPDLNFPGFIVVKARRSQVEKRGFAFLPISVCQRSWLTETACGRPSGRFLAHAAFGGAQSLSGVRLLLLDATLWTGGKLWVIDCRPILEICVCRPAGQISGKMRHIITRSIHNGAPNGNGFQSEKTG
jgi:hypothetical protein